MCFKTSLLWKLIITIKKLQHFADSNFSCFYQLKSLRNSLISCYTKSTGVWCAVKGIFQKSLFSLWITGATPLLLQPISVHTCSGAVVSSRNSQYPRACLSEENNMGKDTHPLCGALYWDEKKLENTGHGRTPGVSAQTAATRPHHTQSHI